MNRVIITELQGEPWADRPLDQISLAEQFQTMNVEIFKDNIEFAQQTGFEQVYLWGAEWWYWLKQQGDPSFWDAAHSVFRNQTNF